MTVNILLKCFILICLLGILIFLIIKRKSNEVKACGNCKQENQRKYLTLGIKDNFYKLLCAECDTTKELLKTKPPD